MLSAHHPHPVGAGGREPWVLLIVGHDEFTDPLAGALARAGLGSIVADSADVALRVVPMGPSVSAVIVDVTLSHTDGLDVCRHLRRIGSTMPVIAISGRSDPAGRMSVREAGANAYLTAPAPSELVELVVDLIARSDPHRHAKSRRRAVR